MRQKEQELRQELEDLQKKLQDPSIFASKDYSKIAKRQNELEEIISLLDKLKELDKQMIGAKHIIDNSSDEDLKELANSETLELAEQQKAAEVALSTLLTPKDPNDERDAIMEIRAAAGGDEKLKPGSASRVLCFLSIQLYLYPIDPSYCIVLSLLLWFRYRI